MAFATPEGLWHYAIFQTPIDKFLKPYKEFLQAYLYDIVIFSQGWESPLKKVQLVLDALWCPTLYGEPWERMTGVEKAHHLGYVIDR